MTTQHKTSLMAEGISEEAVSHYLQKHPEFFERHGQLLANLRVPHVSGGSAVSLVERQVSILRQRNRNIERDLRELIEVGRANDLLAGKVHKLAIRLLRAADVVEVLQAVETALREDFEAQQAVLVLLRPADKKLSETLGRFLRTADPDDEQLRMFRTFLERGRPRCGQIRDSQRDFLFGENTDEIGSVALLPLGERCELGILAIGSSNSERFHPAMSTDFLMRIGDLVGVAIHNADG